MSFEDVRTAIEKHASDWSDQSDGSIMFTCPAHDDRSPSAHASEGDDGKVLLTCFAGCDVKDIVRKLSLRWADLFGEPRLVDDYVYTDATGHPVIKVERWEPGPEGEGKSFKQYMNTPAGWVVGVKDLENRPLYELPRVLRSEHVYLVEGEKDADTFNDAFAGPSVVGTTTIGGAQARWRPEWTDALKGKHVTIIPDNDKPGYARAKLAAEVLEGAAESVTILYTALGKDLTEHVAAGGTLQDLRKHPPRGARRLKEIDLNNIPPERGYVYRPFLFERSLVWLFGPSGHGKSIVMDKVMADLSKEKKHTVLFEWEEGYQEGQRLRRLEADLEYVHVINMKDEAEPVDLTTEWFQDEAVEIVQDYDAKLVVINPFILAAGLGDDSKVDSWNSMVISARELTKKLIEETGACVVIIDHAEEGRELAHGGRSKKWISDLYLHVTKDQEEDYMPGAAYRLKVRNLKQAREWVPEVKATVIGKHHEGPLHVQWDYFLPEGVSGKVAETATDPDALLTPGEVLNMLEGRE